MKIGIIGCGHMGAALVQGIVAQGRIKKKDILVSDKDQAKIASARRKLKVKITRSNRQLIRDCTVIVLAIKPQDLDALLADVQLPLQSKLFISICAGISTQRLERNLGRVAVVRAMPNMPALLAQGISALCLGKYATAQHRKIARLLFSSIGEVVEVKEQLMDTLTAISGSGPAYFFYLVEKLIDTAQELGIANRIARRLAIKTALGSAMLMDCLSLSPKRLRKQVTSKGGTTEAALRVFKQKGLDKILNQAFKAAARRAKQLGKN